jgi:hypothetical protein
MKKETRIIEINQNFCQQSVITIKIEKPEFYPGEVSERSKERRDFFLLTISTSIILICSPPLGPILFSLSGSSIFPSSFNTKVPRQGFIYVNITWASSAPTKISGTPIK